MGLVFKTPSRELVVSGYDLDGRLIRQTLASTERTLAYDAVSNIPPLSG